MNRKKYIIFFFTLVFGLSSTGLPLSVHYCEMMNSVSSEECSMCVEVIKPEVYSCCSMEIPGLKLIDQKNGGCCETKIVDASVKDKYIYTKVDKKEELNSIILLPQLNHSICFSDSKEVIFYLDTSPPHLISNNLYIANSIFLI